MQTRRPCSPHAHASPRRRCRAHSSACSAARIFPLAVSNLHVARVVCACGRGALARLATRAGQSRGAPTPHRREDQGQAQSVRCKGAPPSEVVLHCCCLCCLACWPPAARDGGLLGQRAALAPPSRAGGLRRPPSGVRARPGPRREWIHDALGHRPRAACSCPGRPQRGRGGGQAPESGL